MSDKDDGGPAFPQKEPLTDDHQGMTLRDYFAAQALSGFASSPEILERMRLAGDAELVSPGALVATAAYVLADAMLAARST